MRLRLTIIIFGILFLITSETSAQSHKKRLVRGLWVVRHTLTTPGSIDKMLQLSRQCGITDLFVQVRGRGDAYYRSSLEPKAKSIPDSTFDPLDYLLQQNRSDSIRIHAWLNVFYVWSKDSLPGDRNHIVNRNGHWLARSSVYPDLLNDYPRSVKRAHVEGLFISPLQQQAQQNFLDILSDLLRHYSIDGIHLDYIRYPGPDFDIHPDVVKGFRRRYVLNPSQFLANPESFAGKFSIAGYESFYFYWRKYLMDGLSDYVRKISDQVRKESPGILITAAVKPDIARARWDYYQDWQRWIQSGWLDYAIPMNYSPDSSIFNKRLRTYSRKIPPQKYLIGIALYNQSSDKAMRKIDRVTELENAGFVLFSYNQLRDQPALIDYLKSWNGK
ncbi:MAG TPA: hypothetical protein ENK14_12670 [Caldithrix sp.]|nr:hypothetical protein [Caldithrix sp.]